jgi:hypothetical protein
MKLIAHRGNINGPFPDKENSPEYIENALVNGFDVEIDVWLMDNIWYLGHDKPQYIIDQTFLLNNRLWCHAKNLDALNNMRKLGVSNYFWHEIDKFTLTSSGYIWTYPGNSVVDNSIIVILDDSVCENKSVYAICGDYVAQMKTYE